MATINQLKTFLNSKSGTQVDSSSTNDIKFTVNHATGLSRKGLMAELLKYSEFKLQSSGQNNGTKQYHLFK